MDKAKISAIILLLITITIVLSFNFDVTTVHDADQSLLYVNESSTLSPTEQGITSSSLYALNNSYLSFDGINDYVITQNVSTFSLNDSIGFTYSAWVKKISNNTSNMEIINKYLSATYGGYRAYIENNAFSCRLSDKTNFPLDEIAYPTDNNWHFVSCKINDTHIEASLDGVSSGSPTLNSAGDITSINPLYIGRYSTTSNFFNGFIDEVRIYNRSLEESEITEIYNSGRYKNLSLPSDGLVLYMPFEETNGTTIYDNSGNNNNGVLIYE